jgi:hypothetical protein
MTVFDVYLNDRKVCRAGVGNDGVLDVIVSWVKLTGEAAATARRMKQPVQEARLHVGGLRADVHRSWADQRLMIGDRVGVILSRAAASDPPEGLKPRIPRAHQRPSRTANDVTRTTLLNVDLDIWSASPLDTLVTAFGRRVTILFVGKEGRRHSAHLELSTASNDADWLLRRFVGLVERLPVRGRRVWDQARRREFNVGIQAASKPSSFGLALEPATLAAVARINARIGLTVYGAATTLR